MKAKRGLAALILLAALCGGSGPLLAASPPASEATLPPPAAQSALPRLRCPPYDRESFLSAVTAPPAYEGAASPRVGIVPHHLLASDMIAGFFALAAKEEDAYDTVVILAPSHFPEVDDAPILTADALWRTPHGDVQPASEPIALLTGNPLLAARNNPAALENDHGVSGLIPFAAHFLPGAQVVPVLLSPAVTPEQLAELQSILTGWCRDRRTLLLVSVDFSHYLTEPEAELRDAETAAAIAQRDMGRIRAFTDANVDSPSALATAIQVADALSLELTQLDHSSSPRKLPLRSTNAAFRDGITTYFVFAA